FAQQRIVTLRRSTHRVRPAVPEGGTALDVGKEEREGLRRCSVHFRQSLDNGAAILRQTRRPWKTRVRRRFFTRLVAALAMIKCQNRMERWPSGRRRLTRNQV